MCVESVTPKCTRPRMPSLRPPASALPARVPLGVALPIGRSRTELIKWLTPLTQDELHLATLVLDASFVLFRWTGEGVLLWRRSFVECCRTRRCYLKSCLTNQVGGHVAVGIPAHAVSWVPVGCSLSWKPGERRQRSCQGKRRPPH